MYLNYHDSFISFLMWPLEGISFQMDASTNRIVNPGNYNYPTTGRYAPIFIFN